MNDYSPRSRRAAAAASSAATIRIATKSGVQIFTDGTYAGTIWVPQYPASITFSGANDDVLHTVASRRS